MRAVEGARPHEPASTSGGSQRGYRCPPDARGMSAGPTSAAEEVEARLWTALRDVEDPEIPVFHGRAGTDRGHRVRRGRARASTCN